MSKQQIKYLYTLATKLKIVDKNDENDNLHQLIYQLTNKTSVKELTDSEIKSVIEYLQKLHTSVPVSNSCTKGQQSKAWCLMYEIEKCDKTLSKAKVGERLCAIIRKELHIDVTTEEPFVWITQKQCNKLIEVLKGYLQTAKKGV